MNKLKKQLWWVVLVLLILWFLFIQISSRTCIKSLPRKCYSQDNAFFSICCLWKKVRYAYRFSLEIQVVAPFSSQHEALVGGFKFFCHNHNKWDLTGGPITCIYYSLSMKINLWKVAKCAETSTHKRKKIMVVAEYPLMTLLHRDDLDQSQSVIISRWLLTDFCQLQTSCMKSWLKILGASVVTDLRMVYTLLLRICLESITFKLEL